MYSQFIYNNCCWQQTALISDCFNAFTNSMCFRSCTFVFWRLSERVRTRIQHAKYEKAVSFVRWRRQFPYKTRIKRICRSSSITRCKLILGIQTVCVFCRETICVFRKSTKWISYYISLFTRRQNTNVHAEDTLMYGYHLTDEVRPCRSAFIICCSKFKHPYSRHKVCNCTRSEAKSSWPNARGAECRPRNVKFKAL
jgi:hypothetical protein